MKKYNIVIEEHYGLLAVIIYEGSAIQKAQCWPSSHSPKIIKALRASAVRTYNDWKEKLMKRDEEFISTFNWL